MYSKQVFAFRTPFGFMLSLLIDCLVEAGHYSMPSLAFIASLFRVTGDICYSELYSLVHPLAFECFHCS